MRAVLIGGPFDGAEAEIEYVASALAIYTCDGTGYGDVECRPHCAWKDRVHWSDWRAGRPPGAEKYVLEEIGDTRVTYVYGHPGNPDGPGEDWIADELATACA